MSKGVNQSSVSGMRVMVEHLLQLPARVLEGRLGECATLALLDTMGCGLYGSQQPWGKILSDQIREEASQGKASLWGAACCVAPSRAALANGTVLTLSGGANSKTATVSGLVGDLVATGLVSALTVGLADNTVDSNITVTTGTYT
ncbi:MAG: MmgE/PrpD family protein, partial [Betaproteobacteria bacterium]